MRWRVGFVCSLLTGLTQVAGATPLAYEGFAYPAASSVDGAGGGSGWDTRTRALGSGGDDVGCSGGNCACPEVPGDPKIVRGRSGPTWTASSLSATHNTVLAAGLSYPGLPVSGGALKLVFAGAPAGGWRSFRTLDTTSAAAQAAVVSFANGPAGATRGTFGKAGTEIWMSFLAQMDCGGASCTSSATSNNGGIHLFDGIGNLDSAAGQDGPKHPFEHLQLGDRNTSGTWIVARTTGGCVSGASTFEPRTGAALPIPFDSRTHLFVVRMRFDVASPGAGVCSPGISGSGTCTCPAATPSCLDEISVWIDPDLGAATGASPVASAQTGVLAPTIVADFQFDTVQVGAEGEAIDLDELRVGTSYVDVVGPGGTPGPDAGTPSPDAAVAIDAAAPADAAAPSADAAAPSPDAAAPTADAAGPTADAAGATADAAGPTNDAAGATADAAAGDARAGGDGSTGDGSTGHGGSDSGCGCRAGGTSPGRPAGVLLALLLLAGLALCRRAAR